MFRQAPPVSAAEAQKHALNVMLDTAPLQDIALPPGLAPTNPVNGSTGVTEFHLLDDGVTGVMALGSFEGSSFDVFEQTLLTGLTNLKSLGATQLIVDVVSIVVVYHWYRGVFIYIVMQSNNGGGFICIAHVSLINF